jgi:tRNA nucleotidyltransferase/poly(A) polymerase
MTELTKFLTDEVLKDLDELMIGYAGKEDIQKKQKQIKTLRKKLDKTTPKSTPISEEYDKLDFYVKYYENLTPKGFEVQKKSNSIIITPTSIKETITEAQSKLKLNLPKEVRDIHTAFKKEGKKLFVVGGAVRDAILGKTPKDFDLATDAKPDEVLTIADKYGFSSVSVGKAFGVVVINDMEVATFRKDIGKGRRPDSVDYTDIHGDVLRRDLTINALFYDLDRGEIVDLVGGIADLKKNRIRTVGVAAERFDEDPLRKLRVLRFAARLGGKIEDSTMEALRADPTLKGVSAERVRDEFIKSIKSAKSVKWYLRTAEELNMLEQIFPNTQLLSKDFIEEGDYRLLLAYLFRRKTPEWVFKYLMGLKYTNDEAYDIRFLIKLSDFKPETIFMMKKMGEHSSLTDAEIIRWGKLVGVDLGKFVRFKLTVSGHTLMGMGYSGKAVGEKMAKMETEKYLKA